MQPLAITKSYFTPVALAHVIGQHYGFATVRCQLLSASMRDVYWVAADQQRYIFYVYRHGLRSPAEIVAEWTLVDYLAAQQIAVAPAIRTRPDKQYLVELPAPEGLRYGVLTAFVPGQNFRRRATVPAVTAYGRAIATVHQVADTLPQPLHRPGNEISHLIEQASRAFVTVAQDQPERVGFVLGSTALLQAQIERLPHELPAFGLIHGDVNRANAQVGADDQVTVLDFDLCTYGWRAYDVASFLFAMQNTPTERDYAAAFLQGYNEVRPLAPDETASLPLFLAARALLALGFPALEVDTWGRAFFEAQVESAFGHFARRIADLKNRQGDKVMG